MKVSEFKKIEEGFFSDVYSQAFKGMSNDPERDKKEISKRTGPLFINDFIKDLNTDLTAALTNKAITTTPTQTKPIDREEELAGVADLGYNENIKFDRLNRLIEGIISEQEVESMDQYVVRWFAAYMQGVEWKEYEPKINEIAKEIMSSYQQDKGKKGIQKLANIAWEATSKDREIPSGARNVPGMSNPASTGSPITERDVENQYIWLEKLRANDRPKYEEFINKAIAYLTNKKEPFTKLPRTLSGNKFLKEEIFIIDNFRKLSQYYRDSAYKQAMQAAGYTK